ncbi:MAG: ROK family protein [Chloroflexi bacterium]|nr:ROK family protein [Chloroflexota bacterium]
MTSRDGHSPEAARVGSSDDPVIPRVGTRLEGQALGIDVGGTGVKAAVVDLPTGELASDRIREKTPQPATPEAVIETIGSVIGKLRAAGSLPEGLPAGCGLPGVVKYGRLKTAANIDPGWLDVSAEELMKDRLGFGVLALNDADAAGLAEMTYGAGSGQAGTVLVLTVGTGIGSALFVDGVLVPNTELGHLEMGGKDAETRVSGAARERRHVSWKRWIREFNGYLARVEAYLWPDLIILGGGVSKEWAKFEKLLETRAPTVPAKLLNSAGIAGAALAGAYAQQVGGSQAPASRSSKAAGSKAAASKAAGSRSGRSKAVTATIGKAAKAKKPAASTRRRRPVSATKG